MSGTDLELPATMDANPEPEGYVQTPGERQMSAREQIMARAVENRQAQIDADNAQAAIYTQEATDAGLNFPSDDEQEPAPRQEAEPPPRSAAPARDRAPAVAPVPGPQVRTINIDGNQYTVTDQQEAELVRLGLYAHQALQQYRPEPAAPPPEPEPAKPIADRDAIRDAVRKTQFSGEDDAVTAWETLINAVSTRMPRAPVVDQNGLINQAVSATQQRIRMEEAQQRIQDEYPDIASNPQLAFLANANNQAIMARNAQLGRQQSWIDIYREASQAVYDAIGKPRPGSDTQRQPALQAPSGNVVPLRGEVLERKRAAPRATQAIDLRSPAPAATRVPTGSEIVDQMRKARGQASMR